MKTMITVVVLSLGLVACSNTKKETQDNQAPVLEQETSFIDAYIELKDAFVATDLAKAQSAAKKLSDALPKAENKKIIEAAKAVAASGDIQAQREQFKIITDGLIELLKANNIKDGLFVQYCPMAFNNTGANWLSMSDQIRNPYFGNKMLKCGRVTEEL